MTSTVFVVDDDEVVRESLVQLLEGAGFRVLAYASAEAFLAQCSAHPDACAVLDVRMPGLSGPDLQGVLVARGVDLPIIFLTGHGDVATSVRTLKAGAQDFLEKPAPRGALLDSVRRALKRQGERRKAQAAVTAARAQFEKLTAREWEMLPDVAAGRGSKEIARRLGISPRTVEVHRAHILQKTGTRNTIELAHLTNAADWQTYRPAAKPRAAKKREG